MRAALAAADAKRAELEEQGMSTVLHRITHLWRGGRSEWVHGYDHPVLVCAGCGAVLES